jgi:predicted NUDIX family NTP pyrophosphohydrolase
MGRPSVPVVSAGLLVYRKRPIVEVLVGHMGGPFWARRDDGAWSIPKGECDPGEAPVQAARREFTEELGLPPPDGDLTPLGSARQRSGKVVHVWAVEGDVEVDHAVFGTFEMEWPRGSGRVQAFPEIDRVAWFEPKDAEAKLVTGQRIFLTRLTGLLA